MRKIVVIAMAAAACALPAVAPAHTAKFETKVKIKDFVMPEMRGDVLGSFFGRVRSNLDGCVKNRKVKVFRRQAGDDQLEGKATSDADGLFAAPVKLSGGGVFYAKVRRRVIGSGPHEHVCKGARSPNFVLA